MQTIEIVVISLSAALVAFTIIYNVIKKVRGKNKKCSSGCQGCPYREKCNK